MVGLELFAEVIKSQDPNESPYNCFNGYQTKIAKAKNKSAKTGKLTKTKICQMAFKQTRQKTRKT